MVLSLDKKTVKFKNNINLIDLIHFECSAANGDNIDEIFNGITKHLINKIENGIIMPSTVISPYASVGKKLDSSNDVITNKGGYCSENCSK